MKKRSILRTVLAVLLLACLAASAAAGVAESTDAYSTGLRVTAILDEMVRSKDYLSLILYGEEVLNLIDTEFNTGDYGKPVALYSLRRTDPSEWLLPQLNEEQRAQFDALSPAMREQVLIRMDSLTVAASMINARNDATHLSAASSLQAVLKDTGLELEEPVNYLYVFEKGVPILVSLGNDQALGMFVVLDNETVASADTLQAFLKPYGVEAVPVALPEA